MRLLPTTYARVLALQVLTLLLVLLSAAGSLRWYIWATAPPLARQAFAQLEATDALLAGDQRSALAALQTGQIILAQQVPENGDSSQPFLEHLRAEVGRMVGDQRWVLLSAGSDARIWLRSRHQADTWIGLTVAGFRDRAALVVTSIVASACVIALLAAMLIARVLVRPIEQLASQADSLVGAVFGKLNLDDAPREVQTLAAVIVRAAEQAAQTQRERETILAGISHDLRTPLTRLRLALELNDHESAEPRNAMIADIDEMDGIIESCLAFVRDDKDEPQRLIELGALIRELASRRTANWTIDATPDLWVAARPIGLRRALDNLLQNAEQHGAAPFEIRLFSAPGAVQLQIADAGQGMAPQLLQRCGEPFYRGDTARNSKGAGLGLSIAKRALAADNASLELSNALSGGLVARVRFPVAAPPA